MPFRTREGSPKGFFPPYIPIEERRCPMGMEALIDHGILSIHGLSDTAKLPPEWVVFFLCSFEMAESRLPILGIQSHNFRRTADFRAESRK